MPSLTKPRWADIQSDSEEGLDDTSSTTKHTHTEHIAKNTQVMNNFVTDGRNTPTTHITGTLRRVRVNGCEIGTTAVHAWQQGKKWHPQQYICERTCHGVVTSLAELLHVSPEWLWYHIVGFIQHQSPTDFKLAATCDACIWYPVYSRWAMLSLIAAALWEVLPSGFTVWVRTNRRRCYEVCFEPFQSPQEYIPTANPQPLVTMTQNGTIIACQWLLTFSTQAYDMDLNV